MPFTEGQLKELKEAVARAEQRTSAEIVPIVFDQSDDHSVATWRGASAGVILALACCVAAYQFYSGWGLSWLYTGWGAVLVISTFGVFGGLLGTFVPPVRRALVGEERLSAVVHLRAMQAFVEEEVFATRDRTGLLLFISLFEHRVEVVADAGIHSKVKTEEWGDIVARIRDGIRSGRLYEGLSEAFDLCGELLESRGVEVRPDDEDELPNVVRVRKHP